MPASENTGSGAVFLSYFLFFPKEMHLHVSLLNSGGGGGGGECQGAPLSTKQKGNVFL